MLDFSGVSNRTAFGRLARFPLRLVPSNAKLLVLQGPLRGWKWIAGSGNHGYWLGSYESRMQAAICGLVQPGVTCLDVGANAGFYTLMFSKLTGDRGRVHAFEPLPLNCNYVEEHVAANHRHNVQLHKVAVSDLDGEARFECRASRSMGSLSSTGSLSVQCVRLDTLFEAGAIGEPGVIKIDVEGAEYRVLKGARRLLSGAGISVLLATHGPTVKAQCVEFLRDLGYSLQPLDGKAFDMSDDFLARRG